MSNDIRNKLYVSGPPAVVRQFHKDNCLLSPAGKVLAPLSFNRLLPFPSDKDLRKLCSRSKVESGAAGIDWGYRNWGTKWDPDAGARVIRRSSSSRLYLFITANGAPQAWVRAASKAYPALCFKLHYWPDDYLPRFIVHFYRGRPKPICQYVWGKPTTRPQDKSER